MTSLKKSVVALSAVFSCCFALSAFAADATAKEEMTPPPAAGALAPEQTPAVANLGDASNSQAAQ